MKIKKLFTRKGVYLLLGVLVCVAVLLKCGGAIVKPIVEKNIAKSIGADIEIDSVDLSLGFSVKLHDVSVKSVDEELFHAEHIDLQLIPKSVLTFKPVVKRVIIEGFQLHASCNSETGQWNFRELCEFLDRHRDRIWVAPMITVALRIAQWRKSLTDE